MRLPLVLLAALSGACCLNQSPTVEPPDPVGPDMVGVLDMMGRFGWAQACPISPDLAVTAAHVVNPVTPTQMFEHMLAGIEKPPFLPYAWEDGDGHKGIVHGYEASAVHDLATVRPIDNQFQHWYAASDIAPRPGDYLWILGYDYRSKAKAMARRVWRVKFIRERAGLLIYEPSGEPGTSGGCVLNSRGEVVGIVRGWLEVGADDRIGTAHAIYGESPSGQEERVPEVDRPSRPTDPTPRP